MASMALGVMLTASLCCLSYSQSLEEILMGSVREAVGEIQSVSQRLTELHDRMTVMEGHMVELQASSKPDNILQTCVHFFEMERDLHRDVFNSTCSDQVAILQESFSTEFQRMEQSLEGTKVSNLQELLTTDECATKSNNCSENASCKAAFVEYTCDCLAGYQGDGFTCEGIPCVSPSQLIPTLGCITPVREEMIWEDAKKNCIDQGSRLLEKISTQSEMNELKEHFEDFLNIGKYKKIAWIGMIGRRWIEEGDLLDASSPLWYSGQPNGGDTECTYINFAYSPHTLIDDVCSYRLQSLCQRMNPTE